MLISKTEKLTIFIIFGIFPSVIFYISRDLFTTVFFPTVGVFSVLYVKKIHFDFREPFYLLLIYQILIGTLSSLYFQEEIYDFNYYKFFQYSLIPIFSILLLNFGYYLGRYSLNEVVFLFALSEFISALGLNFSLGIGNFRGSTGITALLPIIFYYSLKMHGKYLIILGLIIMQIFASGMRSKLLELILIVPLIFLLDRPLLKFLLKPRWVFLIFFVGSLGFNTFTNQIEGTINRLNQSILNSEGVSLDTNDEEGRLAEVYSASKYFDWDKATIFGMGNGFRYQDFGRGHIKNHLHITPAAFFFRYGIAGLTLFIIFFLNFIRVGVTLRKHNELLFLWISGILILIESLISASLISAYNLIYIGLIFYYKKKLS